MADASGKSAELIDNLELSVPLENHALILETGDKLHRPMVRVINHSDLASNIQIPQLTHRGFVPIVLV